MAGFFQATDDSRSDEAGVTGHINPRVLGEYGFHPRDDAMEKQRSDARVPIDTNANDSHSSSFTVGGVRVDAVMLNDAVDILLERAGSRSVHLCNAYTISLASKDDAYAARLNRGTLNLCDGMPLVWLARRKGFAHMTDRACGPDLMASCLDRGRESGMKHYLYGSTPEVISRLTEAIEQQWPGTQVVGAESPPFGTFSDVEVGDAVQRFESAGADLVWVGLGTPKQDIEVERMAVLGHQTYIAIGAAFDFIAGNKDRPPTWVQKCGLEWVHRLIREPRRLGKRYFVGNMRFLIAVARSR